MQNLKFSGLIEQELKNKLRTVKDLARFIHKRGNYPSYSIFLGAGASVTSGIESGGQLVSKWRREIYEDLYQGDIREKASEDAQIISYLSNTQSIWYNPLNEYSSLFERKFDLPSQRRRFVESIVDNKKPSIGYYYLINLINHGLFNTVFTTNFDDLLNEAFYHFSDTRPHVCAHDSSIGSLSVLSARPKVIKLHGDYLFDDIKNTLRETESLEHNTKEKFIEFSKDYGLIIVGYSGQDRSIMDVINFLLQQEEYLKNGVYWCFREDDEISHEVRKILWKDKVYCVKIDGFDQLFAELNHLSNIPVKQLGDNNNKINQYIKNFLQDDFSLGENKYIRKDLINFREKSNSQNISELIAKINENNKSVNLSSIDFKNILEIEKYKSLNNFKDALNSINKHLSSVDLSRKEVEISSFQQNLIINKIDCLYKINKFDEAISLVEELIEYDEYNFSYHMKKVSLLKDNNEKLNYLLESNVDSKFNHLIGFKNEICRLYISNFSKTKIESKLINIDKCLDIVNSSIAVDNSLDNSAYLLKVKLLDIKKQINSRNKRQEQELKKINEQYHEEVKSLLNNILEKNPCSVQVVDTIIEYIEKIDDISSFQNYSKKLLEITDRSSIKHKNYIIKNFSQMFISNKFFDKVGKEKILNQMALSFFSEQKYETNIHFLMRKIYFTISRRVSDYSINDIVEQCIRHNMLPEIACDLVGLIGLLGMKEKILKISDKMKEKQDDISIFNASLLNKYVELYIDGEDSATFLDYAENCKNLAPDLSEYATKYTYDLLLAKKYKDLIDFVNDNSALLENLDEQSQAIMTINEYTAYKNIHKKLEVNQIDKLTLIISKSYSTEISICAKSLKDDPQVYASIKQLIDKDFHFYYLCLEWPAISKDIKQKINNDYKNMKLNIAC